MKPLRPVPTPHTSASATESAVGLSDTLKGSRDTYLALLATGMDPFEAIEPAAQGDRTVTAHLWLEALRLVEIPTGTFLMGSPKKQKGQNDDEGPQREVEITRPFKLGALTVTQGCWEALMGTNPSYFKGDPRLPVDQVSWTDLCGADGFIAKLNALTEGVRPEGIVFRLPSEAEWEYACRAGTDTAHGFVAKQATLAEHGWFDGNADSKTHPVGLKKPNAWGLYDMHGNVWEWCQDIWHKNYKGAPKDGSAWMSGGKPTYHNLRGGSWANDAGNARSACRFGLNSDSRLNMTGFRLVLAAVVP